MANATQTNAEQREKTTPKNIAAERAVLAGMCQYGQDIFTELNEIVNVDCFTTNDNQIVFKVIQAILTDSKNADFPSVIAKYSTLGFGDILQDKNQCDYFRSLFSFSVSRENAIKNGKVARKLEVARKAQNIARQVYGELSGVNGTESIDSIISKIEQPIFDYTTSISSESDDKTELLHESVDEYIEHVSQEASDVVGVPSPWPIYNEVIGGGRRRGGVYLIVARPKCGKSSLAINDGLHLSGNLQIPVLYLDTEMTKYGQIPRILANMAKQEIKGVERGWFNDNDFHKGQIKRAAEQFKEGKFYYRRIAGKPFDEILSIIRRWVVKDVGTENGRIKNCLVIYDYFKLMSSDTLKEMQEYQAIGYQIQELSDFCNKYDIPCSAYAQSNRDGISKSNAASVGMSDRLVQICSSLAFWVRKTPEEIMTAGPQYGNMKMVVTEEQRFGPGMDENDWINFGFQKDKCIIHEIGTKNNLTQNSSGFLTTNPTNDPEFSDEDFDAVDYGDSQYRTD